ncbi:MAG: YceI family protein [Alphaproteobacteria bacterium]
MKKIFAFVLATLLLAAPAYAAPEKYSFDPLHTQIVFKVSHLGFSKSQGRFTKFDGGFIFDKEKPAASSVDVTIDANSINMMSTEWDDHLKGENFFNTKKFPTITFKSKKVSTTGENTGNITGDLTILGVTKTVDLDVEFNKIGAHPMTKAQVAGFSATAYFKRSDFGMNYGVEMGLGDDVSIEIQVEGTRQDFKGLQQ